MHFIVAIWDLSIYIPTNSVKEFPFLHIYLFVDF